MNGRNCVIGRKNIGDKSLGKFGYNKETKTQKKNHAFAQQKRATKSIFQILDAEAGNILTNAL